MGRAAGGTGPQRGVSAVSEVNGAGIGGQRGSIPLLWPGEVPGPGGPEQSGPPAGRRGQFLRGHCPLSWERHSPSGREPFLGCQALLPRPWAPH